MYRDNNAEYLKSQKVNTQILIVNQEIYIIKLLINEEMQLYQKHMAQHSTSLVIKEMQGKQ